MESRILEAERDAGRLLDELSLPRHELAAENILAAIRLEVLTIRSLANERQEELQRQILNGSILAQRSGLLHKHVSLVA